MVAPLFVLALPILDTGLAILRRGLRGLPIFRADKRHLHHHLLDMGLSRRRVVFYFYGVTLLFLAMAFAAYWSRGNLIPVLLGVGALLLLLCAGKLRFSRSWFAVGRVVGDSLQMREEVQYTLALMRWLELEGGRPARRKSFGPIWSLLRNGWVTARSNCRWRMERESGRAPTVACARIPSFKRLRGGVWAASNCRPPPAKRARNRCQELNPAKARSALASLMSGCSKS